MSLDLAAELLLALRSPDGQAAIAQAIRPVVDEAIRAALADEQGATLEPLGVILGVSPDAARMRVQRDDDLAALGVRVGRRRLFRRREVLALLEGRSVREVRP